MPRRIRDGQLNRITAIQSDVMGDLCNVIHISLGSGAFPQGSETRTMISGVPCGFVFTNGSTIERGQILLIDYDVLLRIPASQPIGLKDEVQLMEKGVTLVSGTFKPTANPTVNSSVQHVQLKRIV